MKILLASFRRILLCLSPDEITYARRGFRGASPDMRRRIEQVGEVFLSGYHIALEQNRAETMAPRLNSVAPELRGFAFEGAAMGLALLDALTPWPSDRLIKFLGPQGDPHAYMVHVGVGWVWARLPFSIRRTRKNLDPLLSWLAFDGWGFHEGFFQWPKYIAGRPPPKRLAGYEMRAFDQGLGRSWWFVNGGNPELISQTLSSFSALRQADMWSGIGLAATYAGLADEPTLWELRQSAGPHWPQLAQGAAFAAKARQRAGNLTDYTQLATNVLCGLSALEAARLCDTTLENLPANANQPAYEIWRCRIQSQVHPAHGVNTSTTRQLQPA